MIFIFFIMVASCALLCGIMFCEGDSVVSSVVMTIGTILIIILFSVVISYEFSKIKVELFNLQNNTEYKAEDWLFHSDFIKSQYTEGVEE